MGNRTKTVGLRWLVPRPRAGGVIVNGAWAKHPYCISMRFFASKEQILRRGEDDFAVGVTPPSMMLGDSKFETPYGLSLIGISAFDAK